MRAPLVTVGALSIVRFRTVVRDTRERDADWLRQHPELQASYAAWAGALPSGVLQETPPQQGLAP